MEIGNGDRRAIVGYVWNESDTTLELSLPPLRPGGAVLPDTKRSFGWVDGVVGARFLAPVSERVAIGGRADVAGFGSDFTGQAHADVRVRLSEHWTIGAGYRYSDTDYDKGSGTDRKLWSMVSKGPYLGVQVGW